MGNKVTMILPSFAVWAFGLSDGDVLELEVKGEYMVIARRLENVKYIDSEKLSTRNNAKTQRVRELYVKKQA
jgi:antitoxin component of MazEF toxin-antitoxin module